ncbi:hypothetical protein CSKR_110362 [Clonorchis sinensis]|uniref:Uncharacterized protein n=1 Tax=Clonorchis sinensis TaxID=79923 RepID=A0A419PQH2_CLOSI|nr:hypothetical protein CSKR_110362 [Clonorchis sinensis]
MTVPCHHCTDMLRFMDSPVTVVKGAAIGEGIRSSVAAGSGQRNKWSREQRLKYEGNSCEQAIRLGMTVPSHHCTDILRFLDSLAKNVMFEMIGLGMCASVGSGIVSWPFEYNKANTQFRFDWRSA